MAYQDTFQHADDVIAHLSGLIATVGDPLLSIKYVGFVSVAAVTVYEMAIKSIFIEFATKKHAVLESFTKNYFNQINGRIRPKHIKDDYVPMFGDKYLARYKKKLALNKDSYLQRNRRDFVNSYNNLITWRNDFAHEGRLSTTVTFAEVVQAYEDGKEVIHCLATSMVR